MTGNGNPFGPVETVNLSILMICSGSDTRNAWQIRERFRAQHVVLGEDFRHATAAAFPCGGQRALQFISRLSHFLYRK
ncbi:hypothetical protein EV128_120114 [Rhizobium azibense]|nr:hypothetical protein EV128_120114 [Rhizobium azibense]